MIVIVNPRYFEISVETDKEPGPTLWKKLRTFGMTIDTENVTPNKNKNSPIMLLVKIKFFSCW